ncbi:MAG: hypothetical protein WA477_07545 [Candidatus Sulfotelmatobacter sp.]
MNGRQPFAAMDVAAGWQARTIPLVDPEHPLMLRAIAAAKKKNDRVDASKIADCLRCDFLPECHIASTEIRDRRRTLGYRCLLERLRCILLVFEETETARTQELLLRWSPDGGDSVKEIVRQQWNFSPPDSVREVEEYRIELSSVTVLELLINPDINGGVARASLKNFRLF